MTLHLYGIRNCDTVKKARAWLDEQGVAYMLHDYKVEGVDPALLERWCAQVGWGALLNRAGTTFRKLDEASRADIDDAKAQALMISSPSLIRRPVIEHPDGLLVGFKPELYAATLG